MFVLRSAAFCAQSVHVSLHFVGGERQRNRGGERESSGAFRSPASAVCLLLSILPTYVLVAVLLVEAYVKLVADQVPIRGRCFKWLFHCALRTETGSSSHSKL